METKIVKTKQEIAKTMQKIARRRPGNSRLVYDRDTKSIVSINRKGEKSPTPFTIQPEDADMI